MQIQKIEIGDVADDRMRVCISEILRGGKRKKEPKDIGFFFHQKTFRGIR
jgi:hypothetical protein